MHRIDTSTAQKDKFGAGKNGFTLGNAQTGVPPTEVSADILDALQEEIAAVIEDQDSGMILDKTKNNQLATAIKNIIRSLGMSATEMIRGALKIASQQQTNVGSVDDAAITPKKLKWGFSASLNTNGYIAFPAWLLGLIIQWGVTPPIQSGGKVSITYPLAYPSSALFSTTILGGSVVLNANYTSQVHLINNTTLDVYSYSSAGSASYRWLSIGV